MKYHFSVIIPTHNRQLALDRCLRSLKRQVYPPDRFEVIVVDDGSVHPVILDSDLFADGFTVSVMRIANSGPGPARNAGAAVAKGQFLAFTDDDCQPDPLWLLELERQLSADSCRIVGGKTHNMLTRNPMAGCAAEPMCSRARTSLAPHPRALCSRANPWLQRHKCAHAHAYR